MFTLAGGGELYNNFLNCDKIMADSKKYQLYNGLLMEYGKESYIYDFPVKFYYFRGDVINLRPLKRMLIKKKDTIQKEVKTLWDELKLKYPMFEDLKDACHRKIQELGCIELKRCAF